MAKELDFNFYEGDTRCVAHIDGCSISAILNMTDPDNYQRRTCGYYIIPDDALLEGC